MEAAPPRRIVGTPIHISTLDGIVNVNSLFTLAVFIGLAWNPADPNNSLIMDTETDTTCIAGSSVAEDLVSFHVYSFSSFLFSSLVALALKQAIRIARSPAYHPVEFLAHVNKTALRVGMLVSGAGSVCGCGFLMMALVNVVQIKLGTLACGSSYSLAAVVPLVILEYKKQPRVGGQNTKKIGHPPVFHRTLESLGQNMQQQGQLVTPRILSKNIIKQLLVIMRLSVSVVPRRVHVPRRVY